MIHLRGRWVIAVSVQIVVAAAGVLLLSVAWWLPGSDIVITALSLLLDLLLLSPLKVGRALFFETLAADGEAATIALMFRYYRFRYGQALGWRLFVWSQRVLWSAVLYLPSLFLFACSRTLGEVSVTQAETLLATVCFTFGVFLTVITVITVEIILLKLQPIPYLLAHTNGLRSAVRLSKRITKRRRGLLIFLYLDHLWLAAASLLILPWPYTSAVFQTAKAATVRRFLTQIPQENASHVLQRRKKYDRMGR